MIETLTGNLVQMNLPSLNIIHFLVLRVNSFDAAVLQNVSCFKCANACQRAGKPSAKTQVGHWKMMKESYPARICLHQILTAFHQLISRLLSHSLGELPYVVNSHFDLFVHLIQS